MDKIRFGTDGWRSIISKDFTFDNVRRLGVAIADYFNRSNKAKKPARIAVGYDTRFLSDSYAFTISQVLADRGIKVILSDRAIPTPALSFAVKNKKLTAGVVITASHNPGIYNGIKIKTASGGAAGINLTKAIERLIPKRIPAKERRGVLKNIKKVDLSKDYVKFLRSYINLDKLRNSRFRILVDAMHGSGNSFIADVLRGTKIRVDFIRNQINPTFGGLRPEPILENLEETIKKLKERNFDLSIVLDGDGDRVAAFAGDGEFIHSQKILGLLTLHFVYNRGMKAGVVKTIAGTTLIDKITKRLGLKLYETPVGFKYISDLMEKEDILIGGEEAGGIGLKGYIPERDGTLAGLLLLEMMAYKRKSILKLLNEMEKEFGRYYYLRGYVRLHKLAVRGSLASRINKLKLNKSLVGKKVVEIKDFDGLKLICDDESWLMLRASGTEPLVRVYAEAKSLNRSRKLLEFGQQFISK